MSVSIRNQICQLAFYCQINQIWRFSNAFGSGNYRLELNGKKHLATVGIIEKFENI